METRVAYKLLTLRKDKTIGPLFINRKQIIPVGEWLDAEDHPTKGYAHRCGWHSCGDICAPHLKMYGRIWCRCSIPDDSVILKRPASQGTTWYLSEKIRIDEILPDATHENPFK